MFQEKEGDRLGDVLRRDWAAAQWGESAGVIPPGKTGSLSNVLPIEQTDTNQVETLKGSEEAGSVSMDSVS